MDYLLHEGHFKNRTGLNLKYRFFQKPGARETMILLHGHGEHCGRYQKFAVHLRRQNVSLAMFDLRGYGVSEGEPCYVERYSDFEDDVTDFKDFLLSQYQISEKILLFGHSNGGLIALRWALRNQDYIQALFLSSPFLGLKLPSPLMWLNRFMARNAPHFLYRNPIYPPYLTHNIQELSEYKKDKLIRRQITAWLLSEMIRVQTELDHQPVFNFPFPVMVLMAGLDRIVDPSKTEAFYSKLKVPYKDLRVFEGFYHEIFNELGQEKVFQALGEQMTASRPFMPSAGAQ